MSRPLAVLRPEPGNAITAGRIAQLRRPVLRLPLFETRRVDWQPNGAGGFDALLLTSANAIRHGGPGLEALRGLPVLAVGSATASAANDAGFRIAVTGPGNAETLIEKAEAAGFRRALHLAGRNRRLREGGIIACIETVYTSDPRDLDEAAVAQLAGSVALIHSPRAGARLAELCSETIRCEIAVAAISENAAMSLGQGWARIATAPEPGDFALIETACTLAD
ncbi:uroporphyrinogen-III synthase [Stakelama tenebrarum]|uniref:Uroporphyrinogen-III synthase n=1 Tax=Stakelama tenebrarum TaxID=2711215 RepID=A0A6G6Y130_9SPHN|nr:uroporphyrinogen-III synthase [Sphingosinithalassobacter tenebrarum]QIG78635.1 uroporphyrinogen-III synthase [Sphingosinithalassobacter tenebrarum]